MDTSDEINVVAPPETMLINPPLPVVANAPEPFWIRHIKRQIFNNKNFILFIGGKPGTGKSWSAIGIAKMLNKDFTMDRVVFRASDLMKIINDPIYQNKKGIVIIWDEAGIELSNQNWFNLVNKMINFLMQTFRHRNFILIFTSPFKDFIQASTRKLIHAEFTTTKINRKEETCWIKPKLIQYNDHNKKYYYKYLLKKVGPAIVPIKIWKIKKTDKALIDAYEKKKNEFTRELNQRIERTIKNYEGGDEKRLTDSQQKVVDVWKQGIFTLREVGEKLGITPQSIFSIEASLSRKGHKKDYYRDMAQKGAI